MQAPSQATCGQGIHPILIVDCTNFLWPLQQITTHLVASNNTNMLSYRRRDLNAKCVSLS